MVGESTVGKTEFAMPPVKTNAKCNTVILYFSFLNSAVKVLTSHLIELLQKCGLSIVNLLHWEREPCASSQMIHYPSYHSSLSTVEVIDGIIGLWLYLNI